MWWRGAVVGWEGGLSAVSGVTCCPHGGGLSSLPLGSHHKGRKPECLCCAELFPVTARARKAL